MVVSERCWVQPGEGETEDQLNHLQGRSLDKTKFEPMEVLSLDKVMMLLLPQSVTEDKNPNKLQSKVKQDPQTF